MHRQQLIHIWLEKTLPDRPFTLSPASADASFRRYFRASFADGSTRIVMDAPPSHEDCRPYLQVGELFRAAGAHVPEVFAQDLEQGFLLLSDLGSSTYLAALTPENANTLYADALGALAAIQRASRPGVLPEYDRALLLREMMLFPEWYVARHKGITLSDAETAELLQVFEAILAVNLAEPQVFVHRDFHSRNLMISHPNPGVLDFQDAMRGPLTYDVASMLRDAFWSWDEDREIDWAVRYWEAARAAALGVPQDFGEFWRQVEWIGLHRHLRVMGIFCRLKHRDGKPAYAADLPRFFGYATRVALRYRELAPLLPLLEPLSGQAVQARYTF